MARNLSKILVKICIFFVSNELNEECEEEGFECKIRYFFVLFVVGNWYVVLGDTFFVLCEKMHLNPYKFDVRKIVWHLTFINW